MLRIFSPIGKGLQIFGRSILWRRRPVKEWRLIRKKKERAKRFRTKLRAKFRKLRKLLSRKT